MDPDTPVSAISHSPSRLLLPRRVPILSSNMANSTNVPHRILRRNMVVIQRNQPIIITKRRNGLRMLISLLSQTPSLPFQRFIPIPRPCIDIPIIEMTKTARPEIIGIKISINIIADHEQKRSDTIHRDNCGF